MSDPLTKADRHLVESWRDQRGLAPISVVNVLIEIIDRLEAELRMDDYADDVNPAVAIGGTYRLDPVDQTLDTKTKLFLGDQETVDRVRTIADEVLRDDGAE